MNLMKSLTTSWALCVLLTSGCNRFEGKAPLQPISSGDPIYRYVSTMRTDLSHGKVEIINEVMNLDESEAAVFWPIYHDYEEELFDLGDKRLELIRRFVSAQDAHTLDNTKAAELAKGYFQFESEGLDLVQKYYAVIAEKLSPLRALQFAQVEHRTGTVIDLMIASQLPLVDVRSAR